MPGQSLAADMPRKSFLLVPLEASDPVVEDGNRLYNGTQSSEISPTPRKSLFEMDAEDLRAAEQAWLEKVGSFRAPSMIVELCDRKSSSSLSAQQQDGTPLRATSPADGANVTGASPCVAFTKLRPPVQDVARSSEEWDTIKAYREPEDAAPLLVSEAHSPQLLTAEQPSSLSGHDSLTLRQRFSIMQAANPPNSTSPSVTLDVCSMQDAAPFEAGAPLGRGADPAQDAVVHECVQDASAHEVADIMPDAGMTDLAATEGRIIADPSQQPSIAAETFHMPRTPWMNVKTVTRPSVSWGRIPQLPVQEPHDSASDDTVDQKSPSDQAQDLSSMPTSGQTPMLRTGTLLSTHSRGSGPDASAAALGLLDSWAEHSSESSGLHVGKSDSMIAARLGMSTPVSEQQLATLRSNTVSSSGRCFAPDARLPSSSGVTSSLESAAPSAVDRLIHNYGRLDVSDGQADGSGTRDRATVPREQRARQLLRGRTPEECGVNMYQRALAAEQRRQARADALRTEQEAAADAVCTFTPRLNIEKTNKLLRKSLSAPIASATSQSRTAVHQDPPAAHFSDRAAHQPPVLAEPGREMGPSRQQSTSGIRAGQRLYAWGLAALDRQRTSASAHSQREMESMRAASPRARSLPKAIYGAAALSRIDLIRSHAISPHRRKPTYEDTVKECTFQPVTTWRSLSRAATSAMSTAEAGLGLTSASSEAALSRFLHRASLKPSDAAPAVGDDRSDSAGASLTLAYTSEQDLATTLAGQAMNHKQRTDSGTSMPADLKYRQSGSGQTGRGAQNGQLDGEPGHHGQAGASPAQAATWNLSEQLNFAEFLQRQQSHLEMRTHHMERTRQQISLETQSGLGISPGSRALLKRWTFVPVQRRALHGQKSAPGQLKSASLVHSWTADQAFRPRITAKARLRRAHTIAELHDGGMSRRERALDELRAEKLLAEEKLLTFRPSINHYYHTSRPQLRLSNPAPYLAHVQSKALKRRESLLRMKSAAEEGELKECTHSPQTTKLPSFIQRLARDFAADSDRHREHAEGLISPRSEDEGLGHLFTILQPEWR